MTIRNKLNLNTAFISVLLGAIALSSWVFSSLILRELQSARSILENVTLQAEMVRTELTLAQALILSSFNAASDENRPAIDARVSSGLKRLEFMANSTTGQTEMQGFIVEVSANTQTLHALGRELIAASVNQDFAAAGKLSQEFKVVGGKLEQSISNLSDKSRSAAQIGFARTEFSATLNANLVQGCCALSIIVAVFFSYRMSRSITVPFSEVVAYSEDVAAGDLERTLDMRRKDEIGHLADALRKMVDSLRAQIAEAEASHQQALEEAEKAARATNQAEDACKAAELAEAQGMLQAAEHLEGIAEVLMHAVTALSESVEHSRQGAEFQSARIMETSLAMEQMNLAVLDVAKNASQAAGTTDATRAQAQEGAEVVNDVLKGMNAIQRQAGEMEQDMQEMTRHAEGIGRILNVITDIADQTNLLALNAAIEAARAGDAGRGFAVVADEVRKLAEKTMSATKDVANAVHDIQNGATRNSQSVGRTGASIHEAAERSKASRHTLERIVELVGQASDQVRTIATASEEQSATSETITKSFEDIRKVSETTTVTMQNCSQDLDNLSRQSRKLQQLIADLKTYRIE